MAGIDKMWLKSYDELDQLRKWALAYYPNLILYMYSEWLEPYEVFKKSMKDWIERHKEYSKLDYLRLGDFTTKEEAIMSLISYYKDKYDYDCPREQAEDEVENAIKYHNLSDEDWEYEYNFPIMHTPFKVDRKLKWICPLPFVREYLHKQCGVNPKWEWLYRIFWRGKKYF